MKLHFLFDLLRAGHSPDLRMTHAPVVRAIPHAAAAANDDRDGTRVKLRCRWRPNRKTGRVEARWTTHD